MNDTQFKLSGATRAEVTVYEATDEERVAREAGELVPVRTPTGHMKLYTPISEVISAVRGLTQPIGPE